MKRFIVTWGIRVTIISSKRLKLGIILKDGGDEGILGKFQ